MSKLEEYLMVQAILGKKNRSEKLTSREEAILAYSPYGTASSCGCNPMNVIIDEDSFDS